MPWRRTCSRAKASIRAASPAALPAPAEAGWGRSDTISTARHNTARQLLARARAAPLTLDVRLPIVALQCCLPSVGLWNHTRPSHRSDKRYSRRAKQRYRSGYAWHSGALARFGEGGAASWAIYSHTARRARRGVEERERRGRLIWRKGARGCFGRLGAICRLLMRRQRGRGGVRQREEHEPRKYGELV